MARIRGLASLIALVAGVALAGSPVRAEDDASASWVRIAHPDYPLSLELPQNATLQPRTAFSLAQARADDHRRIDVTLFGLRALSKTRRIYDAVQFGIFWVNEQYAGTDAAQLAELHRSLATPEVSERLVRSVFYARPGGVELSDAGRDFVNGYPARRLSISKTVAAGTPQERRVEGRAVVIPVSAEAALVVIARFDPQATEAEREREFPRVVQSLRLLLDDAEPEPQKI